ADLEGAPLAVRELVDRMRRLGVEPERAEQLVGALEQRPVASRRPPGVGAAAADRLHREGDVVDDAGAAEQPRDLERAREAVAGASVRRPRSDVDAGEDDRAVVAGEL